MTQTRLDGGGGPPIPPIDISKISLPKDMQIPVENEIDISNALPNLVRGEATALLLDVNNLFRRARENNFRIDYVRLKSIFDHRCDLRYCGAFSAVDPQDPKSLSWAKKLDDKGYTVVTKDLRRWYNSSGKLISKGNMDIELTLAAMSLSDGFAHIILGTCDGDFIPLIDKLREGNFRKVSVLGMRNDNWTGMSESLVAAADNFYDMMNLKEFITYTG